MRLRTSLVSVLAACMLAVTLAVPVRAQLQLPRISPKATVTQTIGLTDLSVTYSRPGVKSRTIWGELVPYDKPWRTGANEPTTLVTSGEIEFGGKKLPAGSYSMVTIPGKEEWTVALNSGKDIWTSGGYKPELDVLRVTAKPTSGPEHEWMQFTFENLTPNSANLVLRWEKLQLQVPITVDVDAVALGNARTAMAKLEADDWRTPYQAASYAFSNDVALEEARGWLDKSLAVQQNYQNLTLLARWQMKAGKKQEAVATAKKAIAAGKAAENPVDTSGTEKLMAEWSGAGSQ